MPHQDRLSAVLAAQVIPGWMSTLELTWLAAQAAERDVVVEIGSWKGRSTKCLARAARSVVFAVDHWLSTPPPTAESRLKGDWQEVKARGADAVRAEFMKNLAPEIESGKCVPIGLPSGPEAVARVRELLKGRKIGLLFIDADHEYSAVVRDIELWRPLLEPGGMLSGHDYNAIDWPGVVRAARELVPGHKVIPETEIWYDPIPNDPWPAEAAKPYRSKPIRISFCTAAMGRLHHLRETLTANLVANADYPSVEYAVLDYNSKDGMEAWARETLGPHIRNGKVLYAAERTATHFEKCRAKNLAHLVSSGDVLCNIDADNYTGPGYAEKLAELFSEDPQIVVTSDNRIRETTGKIAMTRANFMKLRGYDESLLGYGTEDVDLVKRAKAAGLRHIAFPWSGEDAIYHDDRERSQNLAGGESHHISHARNVALIKARKPGDAINWKGWGKAVLTVNFDRRRTVGVPRC